MNGKVQRSLEKALPLFTGMKALLVRERPAPPEAPFHVSPEGQKEIVKPIDLAKRYRKSTLAVERSIEAPFALYFRIGTPEHFKRVQRIAAELDDYLIGPQSYVPLELPYVKPSVSEEILEAKDRLQRAQLFLQKLALPELEASSKDFYQKGLRALQEENCPGLAAAGDFLNPEKCSAALHNVDIFLEEIAVHEREARRRASKALWGDDEYQEVQDAPSIKVIDQPKALYHFKNLPVTTFEDVLRLREASTDNEKGNTAPAINIVKLYIRPELARHIVDQLALPGSHIQRNERFIKPRHKDRPPSVETAEIWATRYERRLRGNLER